MEVIAVIRDHLQENENVKPNTAFLEELKNKLPEFFNDEGFDIEKFQNALKENNINEFSDGYQLNFIGKDYARKQAGNAPTSVIVPDNEHNQKEENKNSKNLFFTGDNLEVLRHLRNNYSNKIDVIYIDPPYNTGNDDFVYPDKFEYSDKQLKEVFGMSEDDVLKLDALKGSKSHSAWLTFMYPRLWLAKQLLTDDGVIFISIDDNEEIDVEMLLGEIFGENQIENLIWNKESDGKSGTLKQVKTIRKIHEYVVVGFKNKWNTTFNKVHEAKKIKTGKLQTANLAVNSEKEDENHQNYFTITNPNGEKFTRQWKWNKEIINELIDQDLIYWGKDGHKQPRLIIPEDNRRTIYLESILNYGGTTVGRKEVENLISKGIFSYPKPTVLIKKLLETSSSTNSIILGFFAGSATTADAVMQLNAEDGGNRKFIMVQLPEKTYELDKNGNKKPTKGGKAAFDAGYMSIDEISRERIKRAAKKIKNENPDLSEDFDGGFKHYRVVSPEKETLDKIYDFDPERYELFSDMVESFSSSALGVPGNASGEDTVLTTWLAEDGYDFNADDLVKYDFAGYKALGIKDTRLYLIDGNLHPEQTKELLNQLGTNKVKFQSIVVYGYSFNVMDMRELERGLSQLNSKVNLVKRY